MGEKSEIEELSPVTPPGQGDRFTKCFLLKCELTGELRDLQIEFCQFHKLADVDRQRSWSMEGGE